MNYAAKEDAYFRSLDNFYFDQQDFEEEVADRIEAKVIELEINGEEYDLADLHREVIAEMEREQADREIDRWEASL